MLAGLSATGSRATTWKARFGLYMRKRGKALEKGALALQRPLVLGPRRDSCKLVEFLCIVLCSVVFGAVAVIVWALYG